jgi:hypothetical protein
MWQNVTRRSPIRGTHKLCFVFNATRTTTALQPELIDSAARAFRT